MDSKDLNILENRLWDAANILWAGADLKPSQYSPLVLGLIFLRFADHRFGKVAESLQGKSTGRRSVGKVDYQAGGVLYLPPESRYDYVLNLPESENLGKKVDTAMKLIEDENSELKDVLPKNFHILSNDILNSLLKAFNAIPMDMEGDVFGKIYEYFLGKFAMSEGQKGGEFFTPTSIVKLIVDIIEPFHGRIFDPACGSGGMFVQSARFVSERRRDPNSEISVYGCERVAETVRLCRMNLAVHGLSGDIRQGNSYYEDIHESIGKFDFVMANPPFNVSKIDKERIKDDPRYPFGIPKGDNGNYLWIELFYSSLSRNGRAGFVMANSASDARASELEIRKKMIEGKVVDVMVAVGSNFFYTVTLPCTLWFLDNGKKGTDRENKVLFIDARNLYRQINRALRDFTPEQGEFIANIARLYRGETPVLTDGSAELLQRYGFIADNKAVSGAYKDIAGLCKVATVEEIVAQGCSLNPGRYVGVTKQAESEFDFFEQFEELNEVLEILNAESRELEERIAENTAKLLEGK